MQTPYTHQHLIALIEAAQRGGRSEREIITIVDRYFGDGASRYAGLGTERGLVRKLVDRALIRRAA
jgi:hypothetical protein